MVCVGFYTTVGFYISLLLIFVQIWIFPVRVLVPVGFLSVVGSRWMRRAGQSWGFCPRGRLMRWRESLSNWRLTSGMTPQCSSKKDHSILVQLIRIQSAQMWSLLCQDRNLVDKILLINLQWCPKITCFNVKVFSGHPFLICLCHEFIFVKSRIKV